VVFFCFFVFVCVFAFLVGLSNAFSFVCFFAFAGFVAFSFAGVVVFAFAGDPAGIFFVVFWTLLPALNALLDWLSWSVTRRLMQRAQDHGDAGSLNLLAVDLVFDAVAAGVLLVALAFILVFGIELANLTFGLEGEGRIDWQGQLALARDAPFGAGLLVTMMLFTTLVPTVMHLGLGLYGLIGLAAWQRARINGLLRQLLPPDEGLSVRLKPEVRIPLTRALAINDFLPALSIAAVFVLVAVGGWVLLTNLPTLGACLEKTAHAGASAAHWLAGGSEL
ncbi:MAG: hypothetical protein ACFB6S_17300, partial [Geminicoccaceae bacterium]